MNTTTRSPLSCNRCGCFAVSWRQTKAGKWYLGRESLSDTMDSASRAYARQAGKAPHNCSTHKSSHDAEYEARAAERIAR